MGDPIPPSEPLNLQVQGGESSSERQKVPEATETPKPAGMMERLRAAQNGVADAREKLKAIQLESGEVLDGIFGDASNVLTTVDETLQQVDPAKTYSSEPFTLILPEAQHLGPYPEARGVAHHELSDGTFVGADGKSIEVTRRTHYYTYEALDLDNTEAVAVALEKSNREKQKYGAEMSIQDPVDPTLRLIIEHDLPRPNEFLIVKIDASGKKWDASVRIRQPWNEKRAVIEFSEGSEQIIGDPFDVARRTIDFAKSATLKPAITAAPQSTPTA
jgi:hypothetical protein